MARRGQCRCGLVLTFHRTAQGYKMRCPSCGAVVRLQVQDKDPAAPPDPNEIDVELVPVPELNDDEPPPLPPALPPRLPRPRRSSRGLVLIIGGIVLLGIVGGSLWWFLH